MKNLFCLPGLLLLVFLLPMTPLFSQRYPVQVSTMISPPYSLNLAEYVESGYDRIQVTVNALDMNVSNYRVKLKLVIESFDGRIRIETLPGFLPPPIFLNGGMPEILGSYDVTQHFNINNLSFRGLSKSQYLAEGHLPEGYYRIGFVAMDYGHAAIGSNVQVSNYGFAMAGLFLSDPPLLNLPGDDQKITASGIQNIVFQWTPRHRGSPNSAFSATYIFRLFEVWGPYSNPDVVASTQAPIFEAETGQNRYVYGIADPMLVPGRDYVWQVQVKEPGERDLFRNHGFSEAWMFRYGDECKVPSGLTAAAVNGPGLELAWESAPAHSDYVVQYRPLGTGTSWAVENTLTGSIRLYNVSGGTDYEVQVMANCGTFSSGFCERLTITLPEETKRFQCNTEPVLPEITNYEPLPALTPRSMFTAGGFDCRVVESSGSNGIFSGECLVIVPYYGYAQVLHTFKDIHINTDRVMTSGKLVAVVDSARAGAFRSALEDQPWGGGTSSGLTNEQLLLLFNAYEAITTEEEIEDIHTGGTDGPLIITCSDGSTQENNYPAQYPIIVSDGQGNQYLVDEGGEATLITPDMVAAAEAERGAGTTAQTVNNVDSVIALLSPVRFMPAEGMKYGFDSLKYPELQGQYNTTSILSGPVTLHWKAVATGTADVTEVKIPDSESMQADAISFSLDGTPLTLSDAGSTKLLNLTALTTVQMSLEATYNLLDTAGNRRSETIGRLDIVGYNPQTLKLIVVPVNGAAAGFTGMTLQEYLNGIYGQAVSGWNVELRDNFQASDWDINNNGIFDNTDPNDHMDYTPAMKKVYRAYKATFDREREATYVFLIPGRTTDASMQGYMPFKGQYAFIFMDNMGTGTAENVIAHEIAHGAFNLRHTFSEKNAYVLSENTTDNLMDYRGGSELNKYQWDYIHNPESMLFAWLEDEEEGERLNIMQLINAIRDANKNELNLLKITQDFCPHVCYKNVPLGNEKIDFLKINCSENFENIIFNNTEPPESIEWTITPGANIFIKPDEVTKIYSETSLGRAVSYVFHRAIEHPVPIEPELTDEFMFSLVVLEEDAEVFEDYIYARFRSDTIRIYITRTHTGENSTTGILRTDDGTIRGYTVELPRGTDRECKTKCIDEKKPFDCYCVIEGIYKFEINTSVYEAGSTKNYSLRILSPILENRIGVLVHGGQDDANGWSQGCILPMPNEPKKNLHYDNRHTIGRNNTKDESVAFTTTIIDWVKQREVDIKKRYNNDLTVVKLIMITKTF